MTGREEAAMSTTHLIAAVPLVKAPEAWPFAAVAGIAMLLLAALDFAAALAAKEWADNGSPRWLFIGMGGWIVLLQVGLLVLDHLRYDVSLPPARWVAVGLVLALQAYLVLAPTGSRSGVA
jgi:hypothetical protein